MSKKIVLLIAIGLLSTACFFNKKNPSDLNINNSEIKDGEENVIAPTHIPDNEISQLFDKLQNDTQIQFLPIQAIPINWYSAKSRAVDGRVELIGYDISASGLTGRQLDKIKTFFEKQGFVEDPFNIFADKTGNTIGYKKNDIACLAWEGSSLGDVPNPKLFDLRVQCGFLAALIGGQKDTHGCLISAGYSWCDIKNKCLRIWEEPCPSNADPDTNSPNTDNPINQIDATDKAMQLAKNYVLSSKDYVNNRGYNLTFSNINTDLCPSCVTVEMSYEVSDPNDPSSSIFKYVTIYFQDGIIQRVE